MAPAIPHRGARRDLAERLRTSPESRQAGQAWNVRSPRLWDGVKDGFHQRLGFGGSLPSTREDALHQRQARVLIVLARLAVENGKEIDLRAMWLSLIGVRNANGSEEMMDGGIHHWGLFHLVLEWEAWRRKESDPTGGILLQRRASAFFELHLGHALYESAVRDGFVFLLALIRCAAGKKADFWNELVQRPKGPEGVRVPQLDGVIQKAKAAVADLGRRRLLTPAQRVQLRKMLRGFERATRGEQANLRTIRDGLAHGKYELTNMGDLVLDTYDHWMVNVFDIPRARHRGYVTHRYRIRNVRAVGARNFLAGACDVATLLWAASEEFRMGMLEKASGSVRRPSPEVIKGARHRLLGLRTTIAKKERALAREAKRLRALRNKIRFVTQVVRKTP